MSWPICLAMYLLLVATPGRLEDLLARHAFALGMVDDATFDATAETLAEAGVALPTVSTRCAAERSLATRSSRGGSSSSEENTTGATSSRSAKTTSDGRSRSLGGRSRVAGLFCAVLCLVMLMAGATLLVRSLGMLLGVWTVNEPAALRTFIDQKIAVVIADRAERLVLLARDAEKARDGLLAAQGVLATRQ